MRFAKNNGVTPTAASVQAIAKAFLDEIEAAKYFASNYSNADYIGSYFGDARHKRYALWLASWPATVVPELQPRGCLMWQYTSKGQIDGISGNVDCNYCYHAFVKPQESAPAETTPVEEPWYAAAQKWAVENKIADGTRPGDTATRAEVWAMLYQAENNEK